MATIKVPVNLRRDFNQFAADFADVSATWIAEGFYTQAEVDRTRAELRELLSTAANTNDAEALRFWFGLFSRMAMCVVKEKAAA
jgi:hypothetical protein